VVMTHNVENTGLCGGFSVRMIRFAELAEIDDPLLTAASAVQGTRFAIAPFYLVATDRQHLGKFFFCANDFHDFPPRQILSS
jgi:hypothetical protein